MSVPPPLSLYTSAFRFPSVSGTEVQVTAGDHLHNISDRIGGCNLERVFSSNDPVTVLNNIITGQAETKFYSHGYSTGADTVEKQARARTHAHSHTGHVSIHI